MFCKNCGHHLSQGEQICPVCGAAASGETRFCSACGHPCNPDSVFCPNCGTRLKSSAPLPEDIEKAKFQYCNNSRK